ncbi:hypothetical protein [Planotetraspora kaengkrachanensis]|uniref:Uncharacterized protein n=1 Tax=Planotetraspora kaengkrachanensis TaxID=575193 RepID=A0A8J3PZ59_9ACTN|nr:hypothetical protein [Planotetraspora kaengkrachanensis]GIG83707.1 hypothetical protein Pka01_68340 [Planotetraspora kaengkrachanensis]
MGSSLWEETIKSVPNLVVAVLTLSLGWLVGNRLTARWDERKKRRELDLVALGVFYDIYGQFFAVWKLWSNAPADMRNQDDFRRSLLDRAAEIEGKLESLLVRVASERNLSDGDCVLLGCFRQAVQCLRESIREKEPLRSLIIQPGGKRVISMLWYGSDAPPYLAFKALAAFAADLLSKSNDAGTKATTGYSALKQITSSELERTWVEEASRLLALQSLPTT